MLKKIKSRRGATEIIVMLISIVIFSAVAKFCFQSLGSKIGNEAINSNSIFDNMLKDK